MEGPRNKPNRREALVAAISAALSPLLPKDADATGKDKDGIEKVKSAVEYMRSYMASLNSGEGARVLRQGTPAEVISLCMNNAVGGQRPEVPTFDVQAGAGLYPNFKTIPVFDFRASTNVYDASKGESVRKEASSVAVRVDREGFVVPATGMWGLLDIDFDRAKDQSPDAVNLKLIRRQLRPEHQGTPVMRASALVPEAEIKDGTYSVAMGMTSAAASDDDPNLESRSGVYAMTGFLQRVKNAPALRQILIDQRRGKIPDDQLRWFTSCLDNSFAMILSRFEASVWAERYSAMQSDGPGQLVYVNAKSKGFEPMGIVHSVMFVTEDGSQIDPGKPGARYVPIALIHGKSMIQKVVK